MRINGDRTHTSAKDSSHHDFDAPARQRFIPYSGTLAHSPDDDVTAPPRFLKNTATSREKRDIDDIHDEEPTHATSRRRRRRSLGR